MSFRKSHPATGRGPLAATAFAALLIAAAAAPAGAEISRQNNNDSSEASSGAVSVSVSTSGGSGSSGGGFSGSDSSSGGSTASSWNGDRGGHGSGGRGHGGGGRGNGDGRGHGGYHGGGGHYGGGHGHYGGYRRYGGYYGWGGYGGWGAWWPWWYPGWGGPTVVIENDPRYGGYGATGSGALDLDLSPEQAQIFIDGEYVGTADDYDGFPTFLWLERGTYDVAFFLPGYQTIVRQYTIRPGAVIDVEDHMTPGDAIPPAELMRPKSTEVRDARIRRNEEQNAEVDRQEAEAAERGADRAGSDQQVGRILLSLWPPDAAIYLDGHFLGTAEEVGQLSAGLVVEPGEHELEVVRPGYGTVRRTVTVPSGDRIEVKFDLEKN